MDLFRLGPQQAGCSYCSHSRSSALSGHSGAARAGGKGRGRGEQTTSLQGPWGEVCVSQDVWWQVTEHSPNPSIPHPSHSGEYR